MRRTRWTLRCRDRLAQERFITTSVDAHGRVHLLVSHDESPSLTLSPQDVSRLRRQLAEAQAVALIETGDFGA